MEIKLILKKVFKCEDCSREKITPIDIVLHQCLCGSAMKMTSEVSFDKLHNDNEYVFDITSGIFRELNPCEELQ